MLRSVAAIVGGYLTVVLGVTTLFSFIVFVILRADLSNPEPFHAPAWLLWVEVVSSPLIAVIGGYVCAWIAKRRQMHHAFVLVGVMASMSVLSAIREMGTDKPLWTSIAVGVLGCAAIPLGARLRIAHVRATS